MTDKPQYSVVLPSWDEEPNIRPLAERIAATFAGMGVDDWEAIWIDNGSQDGSLALLKELHAQDARFKFLSLSRNFGHSGAVACGLDAACGKRVVLMDGDQQDPPEMIADFAAKLDDENLDVVYGQRKKRHKEGMIKKMSMWLFYRIWKRTSYIDIPLDAGNFCLMRRVVVDALVSMKERGRFVPGLRAFVGFRQAGIGFDRPARGAGEEKTNFWILSGIAIEGLLAFSVFPLRVLMISGVVAMILSILGAVLLTVAHFTGVFGMGPNITFVSVVILLIGGLNMLGIGLIGEYLGRIYSEVKQRPIYVVRESEL